MGGFGGKIHQPSLALLKNGSFVAFLGGSLKGILCSGDMCAVSSMEAIFCLEVEPRYARYVLRG